MPVPADEYPIHQAPVSLAHPATSDRNFYDRSILHAFRDDGTMLITGLGVYPNLGVVDAFATIRRGDRQVAVRASDALGDDRMDQRVGPFAIEVVEPLQELRVVCDGDDHGLGVDLTWRALLPAVDEPRHVQRLGPKILLDACRFAQAGRWSGTIRVGDEDLVVDESWRGTRDRSWGIRPSGEPEPPGRTSEEAALEGFWWCWVPLLFDDVMVMVIAQEQPDGRRILHQAVRVDEAGVTELGWPEVDVRYAPGTRHPVGATIHLSRGRGDAATIEVETLGSVPLHVGAGYGGDPEWQHGTWRGRGWVEGVVHDHTDPAVAARVPFGVIDHVARARWDGREGLGVFEHGTFGRHDPSGFAGWDSVAGPSAPGEPG